MSESVPTIKVKPWADGQGDFVLINKDDFNPDEHELLDGAAAGGAQKPVTVEQIKAALAAKNIEIPAGVTLKADLQALLDGAAAGGAGDTETQ